MTNIRKKIVDFLRSYQMDAEDIDLDHYCQIFMDDMKKGLAGHESSLQMIPTYIEVKHKIPRNKKVIALDAALP